MDRNEIIECGEKTGYFPDPDWSYTGLSTWETSMHRRMRLPLELRLERRRLKRNLETEIDPTVSFYIPDHRISLYIRDHILEQVFTRRVLKVWFQ